MAVPGARAHLAGAAALFLLASTTIPMTTVAVVPSEQADALLAWKASLVDAAALSSWTRSTPMCLWDGVHCDAPGLHVMELRLGGLGLSGELDMLDPMQLSTLTVLNLTGNNLRGAIPNDTFWWLGMAGLITLDLSSNGFNNSIPPQLGGLYTLSDLRLHHNNLVGDIPPWLCRTRSIVILDLSNNRITGELPDCLCNLQELIFIDLSNNRLTGELPDCWWNLPSLIFMDLSNNSFSGKIPVAVPNQTCYLTSLYLAKNDFVGAFPTALRGCSLLSTVDIGYNRFSGAIPPWIGSQVPSLKILSLRSNNFTGEIPTGLSQLSQLQLLDMANNSLTGSIPVALGSLTSMRHPQNLSTTPLDRTKYDARIDIIWKGQQQMFQRVVLLLAGIDLSGNLLSRCIPIELTNLKGLRFLNLSSNHLSCNIPQDIGSLTYLEFLDLSSNELSGAIPLSISSLSALGMLNISSNLLSGKIPVGRQMQTLTDPTIYSNNSGLCGFPLDIPCTYTSLAPDERNGEEEDHWMYYCVIAGIVSGFWLWFGVLFTVKTWRCSFLFFVDAVQCKIMKKISH